MSYQYTPSLTTNEAGEEVPNYEEGTLSQSRDIHRGIAEQGFEIDEETGEHYVYEEEPDAPINTNDEYMAAIGEAYPQLSDALTYAQANMDAELLGHFYSAAEDGDYDSFNEILEIILDEYDEHLGTTSDEVEEELTDVEEDEEIDELETPDIEDLYSAEPNEELADEFTDLAYQSEGATRLLYQLSARFHSNQGEDANSLINEALSSGFSREELINAFNLINTQE